MIYTCNRCLFTFRRTGKVDFCPDCGKDSIREATKKEQDEYRKNREIFETEENKKQKNE